MVHTLHPPPLGSPARCPWNLHPDPSPAPPPVQTCPGQTCIVDILSGASLDPSTQHVLSDSGQVNSYDWLTHSTSP